MVQISGVSRGFAAKNFTAFKIQLLFPNTMCTTPHAFNTSNTSFVCDFEPKRRIRRRESYEARLKGDKKAAKTASEALIITRFFIGDYDQFTDVPRAY